MAEEVEHSPVVTDDHRWHQLVTLLGALLTAGILGGVATYASVRSLDTNVMLFRDEVRREFDWYQGQIQQLNVKIEQHLNAEHREED